MSKSNKRKAKSITCGSAKCSRPTDIVQKHLIWSISDFKLLRNLKIPCLRSSTFNVTDCDGSDIFWIIEIYCLDAKKIDVVLRSSKHPYAKIKINFWIHTFSGVQRNIASFDYEDQTTAIISNFPNWKTLFRMSDELTLNDEITLYCELNMVKLSDAVGKTCASNISKVSDVVAVESGIEQDFSRLCLRIEGLANIVFKLGDSRIEVPMSVLAFRFPLLYSMFQHDIQVQQTSEVVITGVEEDVFRELLNFIYTGKISAHDWVFNLKLFDAAEKYDIMPLKSRCLERLLQNINMENVFNVLIAADARKEKVLARVCINFIRKNFNFDLSMPKLKSHTQICEIFKKYDIRTPLDSTK